MNDQIVLLKPDPQVLLVRHSVRRAGLSMLYQFGFLAFWYGFLLNSGTLSQLSDNAMMWVLVLGPLTSLPTLLQLGRTCLMGRVYEFNRTTGTVRRNSDDVTRFGNIQELQIRTIDSESAREYRLSLVLDDGAKIALAQTQDEERAAEAADSIADLVNVAVVKKETTGNSSWKEILPWR